MQSTRSLPGLVLVLAAMACGRTLADDRQPDAPGATAGSSFDEGGSGGSGQVSSGGAGKSTTPHGGSATMGGATAGEVTAGSNGSGSGSGGSGGSGGSEAAPVPPYAARSGKFKMVVYSKTALCFRLDGAIATGALLLEQIAADLGLDPPLVTEENSFLDDLDAYELVFFMNACGDVFTDDEQAKFEAWMKKGGAFCGTSSATDTEFSWPFYKEVIGQYYEGHGYQNALDSIVFEESALDHPALAGLPNPWERLETWRKFTSYEQWSNKPGFRILARKAADQEPIVWAREHDNFRSFYTGIGWQAEVFREPEVKQHLTGAIMWTVRREHCLLLPKPPECP